MERRRLNEVELGNVYLALAAAHRTMAANYGLLADHLKAPVVSEDEVPTGQHEVPWLVLARRELGQREIRGEEDNPRITEYLSRTNLPEKFHRDETAWCGAFVTWCCKEAGVLYSSQATARSWLSVGEKCTVRKGAICVLWRNSPNSWEGHVGFVVDWKPDRVLLLGGNQGNAVTEKWYPTSRVLGYRWPVRA